LLKESFLPMNSVGKGRWVKNIDETKRLV